jgi:rubredoxin
MSLASFSTGEFVIVLVSLVGILSMLLLVTASVAFLALPRGRLCPHCGGPTNPVVLRKLLRFLSRWVQWRWCSRCGWEGAGRRGPDLGPLDPPAAHGSGFRWGDPNYEEVPVFYWRSDRRAEDGAPRRGTWSGFERRAPEEPVEPPTLPLGQEMSRKPDPGPEKGLETSRPWYLSWLVSKHPPGFQWKEPGD